MDFERRFGGVERLYGKMGAQAIWAAHIAVIGLGGAGSWVVEAFVRSGVKKLTLIDLDHISESNMNRQIQALDSTLGVSKAEALRARIQEINPECIVQCVEDFADSGNWPILLPEPVSALVDACDQVKAKTCMARWAARDFDGFFVSIGATGGKRLLQTPERADLAQVSHDPLLAQVRYSLRKHHGFPRQCKKMQVPCIFSREAILAPATIKGACDLTPNLNCHGYGSSVTVTASFGLMAANYLLNCLAEANKNLEL